jgi:hypothetical protein
MQVLVSIAAACLAPDPTGWRRFELPLRQGPISSLVWDPAEHAWLMAAAESLYTSTDGLNWESSPYPPGAQNWVSLQLAPGQSDHDELFAITIDGQVWKRS